MCVLGAHVHVILLVLCVCLTVNGLLLKTTKIMLLCNANDLRCMELFIQGLILLENVPLY